MHGVFVHTLFPDIRDLISVDDVMEDSDLRFGPNGGLVFCMEYLAQNFDWLQEQLDEKEDDYILFDCPGFLKSFYVNFTVINICKYSIHLQDKLNCTHIYL